MFLVAKIIFVFAVFHCVEARVRFQPHFDRILVHFDLKGAPPKLPYYQQIFPLIKSLGATGVLMEYEDTFPFNGDLATIKNSKFIYSESDISQIQHWASENDLTVTPLVQTFGHLQFLLRTEKFNSIGVGGDTICPGNNTALAVVKELIRQMVKLYPDATEIHLGGDEAFNVNLCPGAAIVGVAKLSLQHYKHLGEFVKSQFPHLDVLMWNDMMQHVDPNEVHRFGLHELVEPVIWEYGANLSTSGDFLDGSMNNMNPFKYRWIASASKGAGQRNDKFTNVAERVGNHQSWLQQVATLPTFATGLRGLIVTGWQRFNYNEGLCELLPLGTPSLALCLGVMKGKSLESANVQARKLLRCPPKPLSYENRDWTNCGFIGSSVLATVEKTRNCVTDTPACATIMNQTATELNKIYPKSTADEWICQNFKYRLEYIVTTCRDLTR